MAFGLIKHHPIKSGVPWVSGNDASVLKPCLNPGLSDEDFIGSKTAIFVAVLVYNIYIYIYN